MVKLSYLSPIDPHVHLRWTEYSYIEPSFMELTFREARAVGLRAIIEQPNTEPPLINESIIEKRIRLVDGFMDREGYGDIGHFIHVAVTPEANQRKEVYGLIKNHPRVVSGKVFHARSTSSGRIEITNGEARKESWEDSPDVPRINHFEDESLFKVKYDSERPETHSLRRRPKSEPASFEENFKFAYDAGFKGYFVCLHTSNPDTVDLGEKLVKEFSPEFRVRYEVTPHHLLLNADDDYRLHGNGVKMNPPLRSRKMQQRLFEYALSGRVHMYGSDDAPHDPALKGFPCWPLPEEGDPRSGVKGIYALPLLIHILRKEGMEREREEEMFFHMANRVYGLGLNPRMAENVEYKPELSEPYKRNIYSRVEEEFL